MERMWAPWRMEYIRGASGKDDRKCFLCVEPSDDEKSLVLGRKGSAFVIMNRFPYTNGHVMVVPVRHAGSIDELADEEMLDLMRLVRVMSSVFREDFKADGINIGINVGRAAGAGLEEHCHVHMVPRWFGDTNFMPVFGETRIISEHITTSYEKLKRKLIEKIL